MNKKTYYVSVEAGAVLEDPTVTPYEFEIIASPEEVRELQALFSRKESREFSSLFEAHTPLYNEEITDSYENSLIQIYRKINELGNTETKQFFEENKALFEQIPEREAME